MTSKERRLVRKWKRANPDEAAGLSKEEILRIITGKSSGSKVKSKEKKRRRDSEDIPNNPLEDPVFTVREEREIPEGARCWVCGQEVDTDQRATGIIVHIGGDKFYHKRGCGPNNINWVLGHPDQLALLVYVDANRDRNGGGVERLREFKQMFYPGTIMAWTADQVIHYLRWEKAGFPLAYNVDRKSYVGPAIIEEDTDPADVQDSTIYREDYVRKQKHKVHKEDNIMAKEKVKETKKGKKAAAEEVEEKKSGRGSGLIPKEAVVVPKELLKHKTIGKLLKEMASTDDDARKRELRRELRAAGFKLSDESTWKKFLKEVGKGGADDDDDEEEEEAPKKKSGKKEAPAKKKGKKFEEEEEEDDDDDDQDDDEDEEEEEEAPKKSKKGKK